MKKNQLVQIPINHICVSANDLTMLNVRIIELQNGKDDDRKKIQDLEVDKAHLSKELADSVAKVANLENELNEKQDRVLYWYQKYSDLADKLNAVKPDAETEES